jgi:hypothetical protein
MAVVINGSPDDMYENEEVVGDEDVGVVLCTYDSGMSAPLDDNLEVISLLR